MFMASGPLPPNAGDLLSGTRIFSLISLGSEVFDLIVFNSPPLLGIADAQLIASATAATMFVVGAGEKRKGMVRAALRRLQISRATVIGAVLLEVRSQNRRLYLWIRIWIRIWYGLRLFGRRLCLFLWWICRAQRSETAWQAKLELTAMRSLEALAAALGMLSRPQVARLARQSPLPKGVTFLLEVAAGEGEALRDASALTERTEATLKKAAGFYIEQVLLSQDADNYRILGCSRESSQGDLRRHMALIMRWLHPDVVSIGTPAHALDISLDQSIYASRVTEAWETIKTDNRRVAYEASLDAGINGNRSRFHPSSRKLSLKALAHEGSGVGGGRPRNEQLAMRPLKREGLWTRLFLFIAGRP